MRKASVLTAVVGLMFAVMVFVWSLPESMRTDRYDDEWQKKHLGLPNTFHDGDRVLVSGVAHASDPDPDAPDPDMTEPERDTSPVRRLYFVVEEYEDVLEADRWRVKFTNPPPNWYSALQSRTVAVLQLRVESVPRISDIDWEGWQSTECDRMKAKAIAARRHVWKALSISDELWAENYDTATGVADVYFELDGENAVANVLLRMGFAENYSKEWQKP